MPSKPPWARSSGTGMGTPRTDRHFVGITICVHEHVKKSTREWKWTHVLLTLQSGVRVLVELRYVKRTYSIRLGDKVSVRVKNTMPLQNMPCLDVPDSMMEMFAVGTFGCICFPEKFEVAHFDILTKINPDIPPAVTQAYDKLTPSDGRPRRQMTFKMLAEETTLHPTEIWFAFISALVTKVDLCNLKATDALFSSGCTCGNAVHANVQSGVCEACKTMVTLNLNPYILAGLSDETGGFLSGEKKHDGHGILLAELAWRKLFADQLEIYEGLMNGSGVPQRAAEEMEGMLRYRRYTFLFCWTGKWGGGRLVIADVL